MTFLPIVERELRVASRKRGTYWLRVVAALVALLFGGAFLLLSFAPFGARAQLGTYLFWILTRLSLATALAAGLFFTADCLSEEKREGTLGFLFLTDLKGYDVVLGKLLATSLRGIFALLAIFPILAVTFVMGGIEGAIFWKTVLSLGNALFFSLAAGLFVSAFSNDSQRALGSTVLVMLAFLAGAPLADWLYGLAKGGGYRPWLTNASPGYTFAMANNWPAFYWKTLLTSHLAGWAMLLVACFAVPRTWQTKSTRRSVKMSGWSYWWRYGGANRRTSVRRKLLTTNPILWLICRERWQGTIIWLLSFTVLAAFVAVLAFGFDSGIIIIWQNIIGAFVLVFYLGAASQSGRFFMDARRSGLIELLLATPLTGREIVQGQLRAFARTFGWATGLFLCVHLVASGMGQYFMFSGLISELGAGMTLLLAGVNAGVTCLMVAANLIALCWFGMWMGMTSKNASFATLKTLLFVQIIPWMVIGFLSLMITGFGTQLLVTRSGKLGVLSFTFIFPMLTAAMTVLKAVGFYFASRAKLLRHFRAMAIASVAPIRATFVPPPIPVKT